MPPRKPATSKRPARTRPNATASAASQHQAADNTVTQASPIEAVLAELRRLSEGQEQLRQENRALAAQVQHIAGQQGTAEPTAPATTSTLQSTAAPLQGPAAQLPTPQCGGSASLVQQIAGLEMVGESYRTLAGSVIQMFWPVGLFIQTGVAYGLREWNHLQLALSCPPVLFLLYFWFVKESPRWLASRGRNDEADAILEEVARTNGKPPPPKIHNPAVNDPEVKKESVLRMFTNPITLIRTLIIFVNWVVVTMVYYGLSLNVGSLGGSIYLNNFLSSLAELIGYCVALAGLGRLGRKWMHCGSMILGGLACITSMFPVMYGDDSVSWTMIVLANLGKLGASSAFSIIYLFSAELYPTVARNSLMGASSMVARIGGIVSPYIAQLNEVVEGDLGVALPLVVFGGSALVAGLLALLLPETLHNPLPETIDDAINYGKKNTAKKREGASQAYQNKAFEAGEEGKNKI